MWYWLMGWLYKVPYLAVRLPRRKTKRVVRRISNVGAFIEICIYVIMALVIIGSILISVWK